MLHVHYRTTDSYIPYFTHNYKIMITFVYILVSFGRVSICCLKPSKEIFCYIIVRQTAFRCVNDDVHYLLDQHA